MTIAEQLEARGEARGMERGMEKGIKKAAELIAINLFKLNLSNQDIAQVTELPLEQVIKLKQKIEN